MKDDNDPCGAHDEYCLICVPSGRPHRKGRCLWVPHRVVVSGGVYYMECRDCSTKHPTLNVSGGFLFERTPQHATHEVIRR